MEYQKPIHPTSILFLVAYCFFLFVLAGQAHAANHDCGVFTKDDAEKLRDETVPVYTTDDTCETETEFSFDKPPSPEYFHVSKTQGTNGDWAHFESGADLFGQLANQIGLLIKIESEKFDRAKGELDLLIDRIGNDVYIQSQENDELRGILSEIYNLKDVIQKDVDRLKSAQEGAERAILLFSRLAGNKCKESFLNGNLKRKNDHCVGEIAFTVIAGCQINYRTSKHPQRRGIVWIDEVPGDPNYVSGGRLRCWHPNDYQLLGQIFTNQQRRYLCRRPPREIPEPPIGDSCP